MTLFLSGVVSFSCYSQIDIGIFNPNNDNQFEIRIKPQVNYSGSNYGNNVFTVRWLSSYGVTLQNFNSPNPGIISVSAGTSGTDGGYNYQVFTGFGFATPTLNAGEEYVIFTFEHSNNGNGTGDFELIINTWTDDNNGNHYQEYNATEVTGIFYAASASSPLPVELINFSASPVEKYIHLNWTSASEINFSGYELQRSTDGRLFNKIAWVDGKGGHQEAYYFFEDQSVTAGTRYFYRLKMVDEDGSFSYSVVRSVMLPGKVEKPVIAPNPTQGITKVYFNVPNDVKAKLTIIDAMGKVFIEQEVHLLTGENVVEVDMFLLPSGIYSLQLNESGRSLWRERMIKI